MLKLDIFFSDELTLDISIRDLIESPCCPVLFFAHQTSTRALSVRVQRYDGTGTAIRVW
jgi:hypothetical protein